MCHLAVWRANRSARKDVEHHAPVSLTCVDVAGANQSPMQYSVPDCYRKLVRVCLNFFSTKTVRDLPPDDGSCALLYRYAERHRFCHIFRVSS